MHKITVGLISALVMVCVGGAAHAAGYTCPTYKKYTSCNSGYYLNGTSAGNACVACSTVSFTESGTDSTTDSSACTATSQTVTSGYCKQNQVRSGSRTGTRSKTRTCYRTGGAGGTNGSSACTGSANCGAYSYGSWSYGACTYTAWTNSGSVYDCSCPAGYYLSGTSCGACTSISFTDSGTDTGTDTSGCTATSQTVTVSISNGSYKQNQVRSGSRTWSRSKSRTCYRTGGAGGTNGSSACTGTGNCGSYTYGSYSYGSCSYGAWSNSGAAYGYSCNAGYYLSGTSCVACGGNGYYCPGDNSRKSVSAGYYTTGGDANTRTGQSQCTSGTYCSGGVKNSCPATTTSKVYHYNGGAVLRSAAGATAATQCYLDSSVADYWTFEFQYHGFYRSKGKCYYSASTAIYNDCENTKYFSECNAGYFINNSVAMATGFTNSCTACSPGTYTTATGNIGNYGSDGSYTYATSCAACGAGTYQTASAAKSCIACPDGYKDNTATGQSAITGCQISVAAGKYLTTKNGTATASCAAGTAKAAHKVAYGSTSTCDQCVAGTYATGGAASCTACSGASEYQPNAGATSCIAVPHGYTKASNSSVSPIRVTCPAGQFMWHWSGTNGGTTCEGCHAGYYCPGGINIYGSGAVGQANSAGVVPIYSCPSGYASGGTGLSSQNQCAASCSNSSVSNGYIPPTSAKVYYPSTCAYSASSTVCNTGYNLTSSNVCAAMCAAGVTKIRTGNVTVPLYASKQTTPALHINVGGQVCYGSLDSAAGTSAINVNYGGKTYHSIK
ncbi:MAG: hypothetical protein K2L95_04310 [Alphaproteobacteria bacterium]|nr:hypothetical protein [Alphaproteobacteria bacterium]